MNSRLKKIIPKSLIKISQVVIYWGNKYKCPICNRKFRELYPIGEDIPVLNEYNVVGAKLRNAGCWKCNATDRERLIYIYIKHFTDILKKRNFKILHVAPEKNIRKLLENQEGIQYSIGDKLMEGYHYEKDTKYLDISNIQYGDNSFDLVICNHVLEHIIDDAKPMSEIFRILKLGGKAILQVPISYNIKTTIEDSSITEPEQRKIAFGQFDHVRIYGLDYFDRLRKVGFHVERINILKENPSFRIYGISPEEEIIIVTKTLDSLGMSYA